MIFSRCLEPKKEISITTNILSLLGSETTTDRNQKYLIISICNTFSIFLVGSVSYIKEEVLVDSTMDCPSNELSNGNRLFPLIRLLKK